MVPVGMGHHQRAHRREVRIEPQALYIKIRREVDEDGVVDQRTAAGFVLFLLPCPAAGPAGTEHSGKALGPAGAQILQLHPLMPLMASDWINCFWNRRKITNTGMVIRVAKAKIWPQKMYTSVDKARSARGRVR